MSEGALVLTKEERLRNVGAWNEARKTLNALEMNYEAESNALKNRKKVIVELREKLLAVSADQFDGDEMPLINEDTVTPSGTVKLYIDLDSGERAFQMLVTQVQTSLTADEFDAWIDFFLTEAAGYERTNK